MEVLITLAYLVAAALFIFGLKRLSSPVTARGGNRMAAVGMLVAVLAALFEEQILNLPELIAGLALGGAIGAVLAKRVPMTSMPEMVAAFNGFGGIASALVAGAEVFRFASFEISGAGAAGADVAAVATAAFDPVLAVTIALSVLIGCVTFSGSFVAYGKLNGRLNSMGFPGLRVVSVLVALGVVAAVVWMVLGAPDFPAVEGPVLVALFALAALALVLGVLLVLPIGGADMPVVVALLNSYSGLAAAATGFVLSNYALIVSGALVGASGFILTKIMCDAMNRSLVNVLLGGFGADATGGAAPTGGEERPIRSTSPDDVAVLAALFEREILNVPELLAGLALGGLIGAVLAKRVPMTSMPEMVAAFNGFGGIASALVAGAEVFVYAAGETTHGAEAATAAFTPVLAITIALSVLIGSVTFSGSFVAYAKLNGSLNSMGFPGLRVVSALVAVGVVAAVVWMVLGAPDFPAVEGPVLVGLLALAALALVLGVFLVLPIGGADMPVVVALLNSYSGLAAAATGFVLSNYALIVSGALVGASGFILTKIMCDAMNRSLLNVLLGGFGADATGGAAATGGEERPVRSTSPDDVAVLLSYASSVIVVPGYGLAVAQAQHEVREMAEALERQGIEVRYAIHPVAGRMPGHMNVLLAEANVPYDKLVEMDDINADFATTDVVLVIGANDVVNPAARTDTASPIYGMPILNVDEAGNIIVLKRSMRTGYAGVENELFYNPKTQMLFGDAKDSIKGVIDELKALQPA